MNIPIKSFKERNSFTERVAAVENIREKFPSKVPVIVERFRKVQSSPFQNAFITCPTLCLTEHRTFQERSLPCIDKVKYLVPQELTMGQLSTIVRNRLSLSPASSLFLFAPGGAMVTMTATVAELHRESLDKDGFLYIKYASQETFGR